VQKLLKKFVQPNVKPDNFEKVLWAFYQGDERGGFFRLLPDDELRTYSDERFGQHLRILELVHGP
jgi:hypothetical protein